MFLSAQQITQSRDQTLNNLLGLSSACFEASQRLSTLLTGASRDAMHHSSKTFAQYGHGQLDSMTHFPANFWLENSAHHSRLLDNAYEILGEAQKAFIQSSEAQVRVFDEIIFSSMRRAAKSSPWEGEITLNLMRSTLEAAEQSLHQVSAAAVESVDQAEQEVHQFRESLIEPKAPRRRTSTKINTASKIASNNESN